MQVTNRVDHHEKHHEDCRPGESCSVIRELEVCDREHGREQSLQHRSQCVEHRAQDSSVVAFVLLLRLLVKQRRVQPAARGWLRPSRMVRAVANNEVGRVLSVHLRRVDVQKVLRGVLPREVENHQLATRVLVNEVRDIQHVALNSDPSVALLVVLGDLVKAVRSLVLVGNHSGGHFGVEIRYDVGGGVGGINSADNDPRALDQQVVPLRVSFCPFLGNVGTRCGHAEFSVFFAFRDPLSHVAHIAPDHDPAVVDLVVLLDLLPGVRFHLDSRGHPCHLATLLPETR
mmetsp:Transcript_17487/g.43530  ORF Transcript_17487/g.43530 Transcript_17487/m.43530 type:complete len:287 (-) Transcript_17487:310-1170(-)